MLDVLNQNIRFLFLAWRSAELVDKPDSVARACARGQSFIKVHCYQWTRALYPQTQRIASTPAYLRLLRVEVTAFHRN